MFFVVSEVDYFEILLLVHENEQVIKFLLSIFSLIKTGFQKYDLKSHILYEIILSVCSHINLSHIKKHN